MTNEKQKKNSKLRHLEYYDLQETLDKLYAESENGQIFSNLMPIIAQAENIRLAYRNIKRNSGSNTHGTDKRTFRSERRAGAVRLSRSARGADGVFA